MVMTMWFTKVFVFYMSLRLSLGIEYINLNISQGTIKGLKNITVYHGLPFYSFRGIPYAKPNVGYDKFNVALPLEHWSGVLDATKHGNVCPQYSYVLERTIGDEDCLFLNVYTPVLNETANRAVIVYIHGGGYFAGSGDDRLWGPDFLIENDIVLVTMNYRIGVIGFLNTQDANVPGNVGLKDQNLVLKWVRDNIKNFGGSPDRVTICGHDTGASSVHYHMMSTMSRGLFKGAILQSGTAINSWAFTYTPKENAFKLIRALDINVTSTTELVNELKKQNTTDLVVAEREMIYCLELRGIFVPSVEVDVGQDIFLSNSPWEIYRSGNMSDIPVIIGVTESETAWMGDKLVQILSICDNPLSEVIPVELNSLQPTEKKSITDTITKFYFNGTSITNNSARTNTLVDDIAFNYPSIISAEIINEQISSPVYQYIFNYSSSLGLIQVMVPGTTNVSIATYCDDLTFLFYSYLLNNTPIASSSVAQKVNEMVDMWTNFAKEGDPSLTIKSSSIIWKPLNRSGTYLNIGSKLELKNYLWRDNILLWANILQNFIGSYMRLFS